MASVMALCKNHESANTQDSELALTWFSAILFDCDNSPNIVNVDTLNVLQPSACGLRCTVRNHLLFPLCLMTAGKDLP